MIEKRWMHNSVIFPDGRVFVVGGETDADGLGHKGPEGPCAIKPSYTPEVFDPSVPAGQNNQWRTLAQHQRIRNYHSTALLLPSGKILVGGGEARWLQEDQVPPLNCLGMTARSGTAIEQRLFCK